MSYVKALLISVSLFNIKYLIAFRVPHAENCSSFGLIHYAVRAGPERILQHLEIIRSKFMKTIILSHAENKTKDSQRVGDETELHALVSTSAVSATCPHRVDTKPDTRP